MECAHRTGRRGGLVGIDFGHAFGTATQHLSIPELMPFRLTRQMAGVCRPHSTGGDLKHAMIYALTALRVRAMICLYFCSFLIRN